MHHGDGYNPSFYNFPIAKEDETRFDMRENEGSYEQWLKQSYEEATGIESTISFPFSYASSSSGTLSHSLSRPVPDIIVSRWRAVAEHVAKKIDAEQTIT